MYELSWQGLSVKKGKVFLGMHYLLSGVKPAFAFFFFFSM